MTDPASAETVAAASSPAAAEPAAAQAAGWSVEPSAAPTPPPRDSDRPELQVGAAFAAGLAAAMILKRLVRR